MSPVVTAHRIENIGTGRGGLGQPRHSQFNDVRRPAFFHTIAAQEEIGAGVDHDM